MTAILAQHRGGREAGGITPDLGLGQGKGGDRTLGDPGEVLPLLLLGAEQLEGHRYPDGLAGGEQRGQAAIPARHQADGAGVHELGEP